jgi:hypothetical protein
MLLSQTHGASHLSRTDGKTQPGQRMPISTTWLSLRKCVDERTHHLQFPHDAAGFPPGGGPFPVFQLLSPQRLQCNDIWKSLMATQGLEFSRQSGCEAAGLVRCNDFWGSLAQRCLKLLPDWMM